MGDGVVKDANGTDHLPDNFCLLEASDVGGVANDHWSFCLLPVALDANNLTRLE
jgi:hypothetical protein